MLFIAHDLALVEQIADRIAVLYLGRIVEEGPAAALLAAPLHPYTASLIAAVPRVRAAGGLKLRRAPLRRAAERLGSAPRLPLPPTLRRRHASAAGASGPFSSGARAEREVACHYPGEAASSSSDAGICGRGMELFRRTDVENCDANFANGEDTHDDSSAREE